MKGAKGGVRGVVRKGVHSKAKLCWFGSWSKLCLYS